MIVLCWYDDDLSAHTLHGEHYLRFMCTRKREIRPTRVYSLGNIIMSREWLERSAILFGILKNPYFNLWPRWIHNAPFKARASRHGPMEIIPSHAGNSPPAVQSTVELKVPCGRHSSVRNNRGLPQSFSHAPRLKNAVGESSQKGAGGEKILKKQGHCEDQTQEYSSINITQRVHCGPAAADWQAARCLACRAGWRSGPFTGFPVYTWRDMSLAQWSGECLHVAK